MWGRVGNRRPGKEKRAVAERPLGSGLGCMVITQRTGEGLDQAASRGEDRLKK